MGLNMAAMGLIRISTFQGFNQEVELKKKKYDCKNWEWVQECDIRSKIFYA